MWSCFLEFLGRVWSFVTFCDTDIAAGIRKMWDRVRRQTTRCNYNFHTGPLKTDRSCSLSWLCTCRTSPSIFFYTHGLIATWIMTAEQVKGYRGSLSEHTTTKLVQQAGTKVTRVYLPPESRIRMSVGLLTPFARRLSGSIRLSIVKPFKGGLRVRDSHAPRSKVNRRRTSTCDFHTSDLVRRITCGSGCFFLGAEELRHVAS